MERGQLVEREEKRQQEEHVGAVAGRRPRDSGGLIRPVAPSSVAHLLLYATELFALLALHRGHVLRRRSATGHWGSSRGRFSRSSRQYGSGRGRRSRLALGRRHLSAARRALGRDGGGDITDRHRVCGVNCRTVVLYVVRPGFAEKTLRCREFCFPHRVYATAIDSIASCDGRFTVYDFVITPARVDQPNRIMVFVVTMTTAGVCTLHLRVWRKQ